MRKIYIFHLSSFDPLFETVVAIEGPKVEGEPLLLV